MAVAFMTYAFDSNVKNDRDRIQLGFFWCKAACIVKKTVGEPQMDEDTGQIVYNCCIICGNGDVYLVDSNVTGSNEGSFDAPKFSLKILLRDHIFSKL